MLSMKVIVIYLAIDSSYSDTLTHEKQTAILKCIVDIGIIYTLKIADNCKFLMIIGKRHASCMNSITYYP